MLSAQQVVDSADSIYSLAVILADPDAYKIKLDELKQHAQDGLTAFDNAQAALADSKKNLREANHTFDDANFLHKEVVTKEEALKVQIQMHEANVQDVNSNLTQRLADTASMQSAVQQKLQAAGEREGATKMALDAAKQMQAQAEDTLVKAQAFKQEYETRLSALKAAVGAAQ